MVFVFRDNVRFLIGNTLWINLDQIFRALADLLILVIIARLTTRESFGYYQLLMSVFMVLSVFALTGFNGSLLRALARSYEGTLAVVVRLSWRWSLVGSAVLLSISLYWWLTDFPELALALLGGALVFPFFHVLRRWQVVLHAKELFRTRMIYNLVISLVLLVVVSVVGVFSEGSLGLVFIAYVSVITLANLYLYPRVSRLLTNDVVEEGWRSSGYKLVSSELFGQLYAHLDKLVLAYWLGPEALAVYAVAIIFGEAIKFFFANLVAIYVPRISRQARGSLLSWARRVGPVFVLGSLFGIALLAVALPVILEVLFAQRYDDSIPYAQLYLLIVPGHVLATMFGQILIADRRETFFLATSLVAGLVNVLVYIVFIPLIGIYGAVIGSIVYYLIMALSRWWGVYFFLRPSRVLE